jgi:2,3-bisphosphoglycerate-dependent phosphoglycerate mutase
MQRLCYLLFLLPLWQACQSPAHKEDAAPVIVAIQPDGQVLFSDSTTMAIPHYGDSTYIIFYCVRHTEKLKDKGNNPDLSPEGIARAERLGKVLARTPVDMACMTNFKRTIQTSETARRQMEHPPSAEAYPPNIQDGWLEDKLGAGGGKKYFMVGHSNTIPQLLNYLKGSPGIKDIPEDEFGMFYIAITKGVGQTEVLELKY